MNYEVEYYKECAAHAETKAKTTKFATIAILKVDELVTILGEAGVLTRSELDAIKKSIKDTLRG